MAKVKVTYWEDIPLSVMVSDKGNRSNIQFPKIYMATVDAVATKIGATSSGDYVAGFRHEKFEQEGDVTELANVLSGELLEKHPGSWLKDKRKNAGLNEEDEIKIAKEAEA